MSRERDTATSNCLWHFPVAPPPHTTRAPLTTALSAVEGVALATEAPCCPIVHKARVLTTELGTLVNWRREGREGGREGGRREGGRREEGGSLLEGGREGEGSEQEEIEGWKTWGDHRRVGEGDVAIAGRTVTAALGQAVRGLCVHPAVAVCATVVHV